MQLPVIRPAQLPALSARWTVAALGALPPAEQLATCDQCVQLPAAGQPMGEDQYHPDTKCCTYLPVLYNFQAGALLDDPAVSAEGRASVEARIAAGQGVAPHGLEGTNAFIAIYRQEQFGRDPSLRCPHYLPASGNCGVWQHRNATCTTWFCRCDRGKASFDFWRRGLHPLLRCIEDAVTDWAVGALGAKADDFGRWQDPRAFYRASALAVAELSWQQIRALGGRELDGLIVQARKLHRALLAAPLHPTGVPGPDGN